MRINQIFILNSVEQFNKSKPRCEEDIFVMLRINENKSNVFLLQVAAEFSILDSPLAVIKRLQKTDHVQVILMINGDKW